MPRPTEVSLLLPHAVVDGYVPSDNRKQDDPALDSAYAILPIPFLAALAIAAVAPNTVYAYASLMCHDPMHCQNDERKEYAGVVAVAVATANISAILAISVYTRLSKRSHQASLASWLACRLTGIFVLIAGVYMKNTTVAISSQIWNGLASDNILHLNLNAIYVRLSDPKNVSGLIGVSLGLYMLGFSLGPLISNVSIDYRMSFILGGASLVLALLYLHLFYKTHSQRRFLVPSRPDAFRTQSQDGGQRDSQTISGNTKIYRSALDLFRTTFLPLKTFYNLPLSLIPATSLLLYNMTESYMFPAIMVYSTLNFGFTGRENGYLLSSASVTTAFYLITVSLLVTPWLERRLLQCQLKRDSRTSLTMSNVPNDEDYRKIVDAVLAISSIFIQSLSLLIFSHATRSWHLYVTTCVFAIGFSTPSFVKSWFVQNFVQNTRPQALASLALMETFGALAGPVVLGSLQALLSDTRVFFTVASSLLGLAGLMLGVGVMLLLKTNRRHCMFEAGVTSATG